MHMRWLIGVVVLAASLVGPSAPAQAVGDTRCFRETGYCIQAQFRTFWEENGGLAVFGLPVSEQFTITFQGQLLTAQYFERTRFEAYPNDSSRPGVLLGRVGDEVLSRQGIDWRIFNASYPSDLRDCALFRETNHAACGRFRQFWVANGGLRIFGLPLSDQFTDSNGRVIQWFERARFEYNPNAPGLGVQLGLLGRELIG